jgi:sterol desaturase/sphingolipid hydroxylase (fatty acid hydroxylase superfamily)
MPSKQVLHRAIYDTWEFSSNAFGHCGYEILPRWFHRTWIGQFRNTPTHHAMRHEKVVANFGLYFNVWDRLCRTNHPDHERRLAAVTSVTKCAAVAAR